MARHQPKSSSPNRSLSVFDSGRIIRLKTARSQFMGGIIMGLGMALTEATHIDERNGRVVNANLANYLVPVNADVPALEVSWLDKPDPQAPLGERGLACHWPKDTRLADHAGQIAVRRNTVCAGELRHMLCFG